jgi:hypothetical protein
LLALTTIKFQYLPVLLAPAVAAVRWRVLIAAAVAETVLLIMGGLAVGFHNVFNYPQILAHAETTPDFTGVVTGKMVNLRGALALLVPVLPSFETSLAILAVGVIAAVWICRRGASHGDLGQRWSLALSIVVALVASPHVHIHDLLLLGNAAALTLPVIDLGAIVRQRHRSLALWCYLLILYPVIGWVFFLLQDLLASMRVQPFCLINLILFFSGYMYFHKHIDRPPSTAAP